MYLLNKVGRGVLVAGFARNQHPTSPLFEKRQYYPYLPLIDAGKKSPKISNDDKESYPNMDRGCPPTR